MFEIIFFAVLCSYLFLTVIFLIGTKREFPCLSDSELPSATVIVAARNEEHNIIRCLKSLDELEYPDDKLEIVLVNDKSTDKTGDIIQDYIKNKPRFKYLVSGKEIGCLKGKTNALANGLEIATGKVILTTDADCSVPSTWAKTITSYYTNGVAMVNGFTGQKFNTVFAGMQNLDFLYLQTAGSATINMNFPITCIGNNMSYLKQVYDEVGGYQNLTFSVTEDFNLLKAIKRLRKYKIIFPMNINSFVESLPCPDWKSLYRQKKRWIVGGLKGPLYGYAILISGWLTSLCFALAPFFYTPVVGWFIFFKVLLDILLLQRITSEFGISNSIKHFWAFQIYYVVYVLVLPFIVIPNRRVIWKDRTY